MINITRLYCGEATPGDGVRYGSGGTLNSAKGRRPVVVWNTTRTCNLKCIHCYTDSAGGVYPGELTTEEGMALIEELADFKIPALLLSGGEPLIRKDIFDLAKHAGELGVKVTLSTNGTLITEKVASRIKEVGFSYVGISLDGMDDVNDMFRGKKGAFRDAVSGFRSCTAVGQKVGLRLTLTRHNFEALHDIFDFIERGNIPRACFYHLVYSGRGSNLSEDDLSHKETREALDIILERTLDFHNRGIEKEILTVDNHVDGVYLYMKLKERFPERADEVMRLLKWNGGGAYSSGVGIANIDFLGKVHPDQFWMHYTFGNVRERKFSRIWMDTSDPLMAGLKERKPLLKGKCGKCRWLEACGGALRVRADLVYGDPWAPDPACYLTDEEIGLTDEDAAELREKGEEFPVPEPLLRR